MIERQRINQNHNMAVKKQLKPRRGNVTFFTNQKDAKEKLTMAGKVVADRVQEHLGRDVTPMVTECRKTPGKYRLLLRIAGVSEGGKKDLRKVFDFTEAPRTEGEIRIYGLPPAILMPAAKGVLGPKGDASRYRLDRKGDLALYIEPDGDMETMQDLFKEAGFVTRPKEKVRTGSSKPGFLAIIPLASSVATPKSQEKKKLVVAKPSTAPRRKPRKKVEQPYEGISADKLVGVAKAILEVLPKEERLKLLEGLLPKGVGLYNTQEPFWLNGHGMVVNAIKTEEVEG